jgi:hypothetical protein
MDFRVFDIYILKLTIRVSVQGQYDEALRDRDSNTSSDRDATLIEPFQNAEDNARRALLAGIPHKQIELESIKNVVRQSWEKHRERVQRATPSFSRLPIVERQDILRELSTEHLAHLRALNLMLFSANEIPLIAASYAYLYDLEEYNRSCERERNGHYRINRGSGRVAPVLPHAFELICFCRFPFDIAFRQLAHIKASKTGTSSTIIREFADRFVLHRASLKLL